MKMHLLALVLLLMPVVFRSQNVAASLEGIVVDRVNSEGIAGVSLMLTGIVEDRVVNLTTKTSTGGRFTFANVRSSSGYWLMASHGDSHVPTVYGQRGFSGTGSSITVAAGQHIKGLQIAMVPTGAISGRVLDRQGRPVSQAQVLVMMPTYREGTRVLRSAKGFVTTNRRGEYRVSGLTPGPYYLRVYVQNSGGSAPFLLDRRASVSAGIRLTESEGYTFIYYPDTTDERSAHVVNVPARTSVEAIDLTVFKVQTRRIRGTVVDEATGLSKGPAEVMLFRQSADRGSLPDVSGTFANGSFDFRSIPPGTYLLVAVTGQGSTTQRGRVVLHVGTGDVNDLKIPVTSGFTLSGKLSIPATLSADISVTLRPDAPSSTGLLPAASFDQPVVSFSPVRDTEMRIVRILEVPPVRGVLRDSAVTLRGIAPWNYRLEVAGLPEDAYVKSARLGSTDVLTNGLRVDGPIQESLDIEAGLAAGQIEGRVVDGAQKPLSALRVVLVPDKEQRNRLDLYRNVLSDTEGRFRFQGLPPGDYKLFAWEFADKDFWLDADFLRLYEDKGTSVHIKEGSKEVLEVRAIPPWF